MGAMATNLELEPDELDVVRDVLTAAITDLSPEIAGTDNFEYREALKARREVLRGVVARLGT
jgi:hypothetical protein